MVRFSNFLKTEPPHQQARMEKYCFCFPTRPGIGNDTICGIMDKMYFLRYAYL